MITLGLDIGGTKMLGGVVDANGTVLAEQRVDSPRALAEFEAALNELIAELRTARGPDGAEVSAIGVGIAGLVSREGVFRYGPNLPGVVELPIRDIVARGSGLPVIVDNDANVAGYGEVVHGAATGARHALMVTLGTGIGGAIITDGAIYGGAHGFAGEIGHFTVDRDGPLCACGERGHWEALASGTALAYLAQQRVASGNGAAIAAAAERGGHEVDGHAVGVAALGGDRDALAVLEIFASNVALGLVALANILDPELIVISGGLVQLGRLLFDPLDAAFTEHLEGAEHRPPVALVPAQLGERAGAIGAAALARTLVPAWSTSA